MQSLLCMCTYTSFYKYSMFAFTVRHAFMYTTQLIHWLSCKLELLFIVHVCILYTQAFISIACHAFSVRRAFIYTTKLGGETGVGNPQMAKLIMKNVVCLMTIILLPITASFPAVSSLHTITWSIVPYMCYTHNMQCFWVCTNFPRGCSCIGCQHHSSP